MSKEHPHPGFQLRKLIEEEYQLTRTQVARHLDIELERLRRVTRGELPISNDLAILLGQGFHLTAEYWTYCQAMFELDRTREWMKAGGAIREIIPFNKPKDYSRPGPFDQCLCFHWGWEHIDYPDGGCSAVNTDGTPCTCTMYFRLGGYIAAMGGMDGIAGPLKELQDEEERRRVEERADAAEGDDANGGERDDGDGDHGGVPQLRGDGYGPAEAGDAGPAAEEQAGPGPAGDGCDL